MRPTHKSVFWCQAVIIMSVVGCTYPTQEKASVKSFSCDLRSSGEASSKASEAAFQCAYNAMNQAAKISTGSLAGDIKEIIDGFNDIRAAVTSAGTLIQDLRQFFTSGGRAPNTTAQDAFDALDAEKKLDPEVSESPMYKCLSGNYRAMKKFYDLAVLAQSLAHSGSLTSTELHSIVTLSDGTISLLVSSIKSTTACSEWLNNDPNFSKAVEASMEGLDKIMTPINNIRVLANCGIDLAVGGYVLYNNSACLVDDIKSYYRGRDSLQNQRDDFVNHPINIQPDSDISIEDVISSNTTTCMQKYGIWLQKQSFYSYMTRSGVCADRCVTSNSKKTYYAAGRSIFPVAQDYDYCTMNAKVGATRAGMEMCISFCCDQEGACVQSAHHKAGIY